MEDLYSRINRLCIENGTNVSAVCRELKINRSSLSELKAGRAKSVSSDKIIKLADYFKVSAKYIQTGEADEPAPELVNNDPELTEYIDQLKNRKEMRMLFSLAKDATKADVEKAVKVIEALFDNKD